MKTILWDEHFPNEKIQSIAILKKMDKTLQFFYIYCKEYNTYLLYHNVEL